MMKINNRLLFQERKAAQAAAFMLFKAGGQLEVLKLMKLLYLAERESLLRFGELITGDAFVSMPHGPVLSMTLDCINGGNELSPDGWSTWVSDKENHILALKKNLDVSNPEQDLVALSESDLEVLASVWEKYGNHTAWELRNMTHNGFCPEWIDPNGSSHPIPLERLLEVLGYNKNQINALVQRMCEQAEIAQAFI